nr:MAG TPA: hypothetical protein [Caudoviricetes sp.]
MFWDIKKLCVLSDSLPGWKVKIVIDISKDCSTNIAVN